MREEADSREDELWGEAELCLAWKKAEGDCLCPGSGQQGPVAGKAGLERYKWGWY